MNATALLKWAEFLAAANEMRKLAGELDLEGTIPVVLDGTDVNDLALVLQQSPFSSELLSDGVLFVPQVYEHSALHARVHRMGIEGIGPTPRQAALNFLSGADGQTLHSLSDDSDKFFDKFAPLDSAVYVRRRDLEKGFFLKRDETGRFVAERAHRRIPMDDLRKEVGLSYASLGYMSNRSYQDNLQAAYDRQATYQQIHSTYLDAFARAELDALLAESMRFREQAVAHLQAASKADEEAGKWAGVAQGLSFLSALLSVAGSIESGMSSAEAEKAAANSAARVTEANTTASLALQKAAEANRRAREAQRRLEERSVELNELIRSVVPNVPLPRPILP